MEGGHSPNKPPGPHTSEYFTTRALFLIRVAHSEIKLEVQYFHGAMIDSFSMSFYW